MRKLIIILLLASAALIACNADKEISNPQSSEDSASVVSSESSEVLSVNSVSESSEIQISSCDTTVDSSESTESESSEYSSELPSEEIIDVAAVAEEIAKLDDNGVVTSIEGSEKLSELKEYLEKTDFGVFYCDLNYNNYIAYGSDREFPTASTAKLPYIKYLCTLADSGSLDIDEKLVYEKRFYDIGSGILKNESAGKSYKVETLMEYTLKYSDNIAYKILLDRFGSSGFNDYVESLGVDYSIGSSGYTKCTSSQIAALLFDVAHYEGKHQYIIMEAGSDASFNRQIGYELSEYTVVQKYGAMKPGKKAYHDIAIVYADTPYILVIYTKLEYESSDKNVPFREISRMIDDINKEVNGV